MRRTEWSSMQISGFLGFIHKLVMFVTYPLRHPFYLLFMIFCVSAVIYLVPVFYGVGFKEVPAWYLKKVAIWKIEKMKEETLSSFDDKIDDLKQSLQGIWNGNNTDIVKTNKAVKKEQKEEQQSDVKLVSWNVAKFRKAKLNAAKVQEKVKTIVEPTFSELKKKASEQKKIKSALSEAKMLIEEKLKVNDLYVQLDEATLEYLPVSQRISGKGKVDGVNTLYCGNVFLYLYGIYTDARFYDTEEARSFLEKLIGENQIDCEIVAYVRYSKVPTALCFVNGVFINKVMVDNNFASNVALK